MPNPLLDAAPAPSATYSYYVKSRISAGQSAASDTASLAFPPTTPTGLTVAFLASAGEGMS